jgi:hypothetical protein
LNLSGKTKRNFTPFQNNPGIREETLTSLGYLRYATLSLLIVLMGGYVSE